MMSRNDVNKNSGTRSFSIAPDGELVITETCLNKNLEIKSSPWENLESERGWCDHPSWVEPGQWDPVRDFGVPQDGCLSEVSNRLEGREVARGVPPGAGARASLSSGGGFFRWRFFLSLLVVVLLAVALAVVDGLSGPVDSAAALNGKSPGFRNA